LAGYLQFGSINIPALGKLAPSFEVIRILKLELASQPGNPSDATGCIECCKPDCGFFRSALPSVEFQVLNLFMMERFSRCQCLHIHDWIIPAGANHAKLEQKQYFKKTKSKDWKRGKHFPSAARNSILPDHQSGGPRFGADETNFQKPMKNQKKEMQFLQ